LPIKLQLFSVLEPAATPELVFSVQLFRIHLITTPQLAGPAPLLPVSVQLFNVLLSAAPA